MRVQAKAKFRGLWMPWPKHLPQSATVELYVVEVMPNPSVYEGGDTDISSIGPNDSQSDISPDEKMAEFIRLTGTLFGENYRYAPEHEEPSVYTKPSIEDDLASGLDADNSKPKHSNISNRFTSFALQEYLKEKYA